MLVKEIMTTDIVPIEPGATIRDALKLLVTHSVSGLVVLGDHGDICGICTEKDILIAYDFSADLHTLVKDFMTRDIVSVSSETDLKDVIKSMIKHNIKRVPVLEGEQAIGIVSRGDVLRGLYKQEQVGEQ